MTRQRSVQKNLKQKREPARLTGKLDASLLTYAIAAGAAGIGMLVPTQAAEAEVVATPANISVPLNGGVVQIDINRDGQMDLGLSWRSGIAARLRKGPTCSTNCAPPSSSELKAVPAQSGNEVWQTGSKARFFGSSSYCAAPLAAGRHVNGAAAFKPGNKAMFWFYQFFGGSDSACQWEGKSPHNPYLGVKFLDTSGKVHYGWVRVSLAGGVTITGYAYETTPGKAIVTGVTHGPVGAANLTQPDMATPQVSAPASLGMLALGAPGLAAWRRQEEEQRAA